MNNLPRNILVIAAVVVSFLGAMSFFFARQEYAADSVIFDTSRNIAINGYDTVAYYKQKAPMLGDPRYQADWAGSTWFFTSAENRDTFVAKPVNYAPMFGGYDPVGVSKGFTNPTNPEIYTIMAGQLYLHYSEDHKAFWHEDRATNLILANSNWAFLRERLLTIQNGE